MIFQIGRKVNIVGLETTLPLKGLTLVEISDPGIVVIREAVKGANHEFFPWAQVRKIEILGITQPPLHQEDVEIKRRPGRPPNATAGN